MARKKKTDVSELDLEQALEELKQEYEDMAKKLGKLSKVNENISINRYDNGWMVEVGGRDDENDWKTAKILCNTEEEMLAVVQEWNSMEVAD